MGSLVGIDLGTSACKVTVVRDDLSVVSVRSNPYPIDSPHPGWAEQDQDAWWEITRDTISRGMGAAGVRDDYSTVSFTGQMNGLVLLGSDGRVLRPPIMWCDHRANREVDELEDLIPEYSSIVGFDPFPAFTLPQLLWVKRNEPETFRRCVNILVPKDYLRYRATGTMATDWTDASGTGAFDTNTREWSTLILDRCGVDRGILPNVVAPEHPAGDADALLDHTDSVVGIGDQFAEALAAGVVTAGSMSISLGTSANLLVSVSHPTEGAYCHAPRDQWLKLESVQSGGEAVAWFANTMCGGATAEAVLELAASSPPGASGVRFLPQLFGLRKERKEPIRAAFLGLGINSNLADMARAVVEGVAFELRRRFESGSWNANLDTLTLTGGGTRSELWCSIIGAVFNSQYRVGSRDAAFGAAMVAGLRNKWWLDYSDAPWADSNIVETDPIMANAYIDHFHDYCVKFDRVCEERDGDSE